MAIKEKKLSLMFKKFKELSLTVKITLILFFCFFFVEACIQLYPFVWVINNSLKTTMSIHENTMSLTKDWAIKNYFYVFTKFKGNGTVMYFEMLFNSVWQTSLYLLINITSSMFVGYNLAKFRFPGKSALYALLIFTQTIPIMGTGAASFKLKYDLNMINNPSTIWLSWAMGFDYSAFILFGSFQGISKSYSESAEIDGANEWQIFFKVIFPQVFPVIVALLVSNFVTKWNDYTMSQITLNKYPNLAYGLYTFEKASIYGNDSIMATYGNGIYYAALVLTALPGVILYATFQNLIIKNMTVGGLKG